MADYDLIMHCCPRAFLTGIAFVLAAAVCAQAPGPVEPADPVRAILDEALAAPAEVFADVAFDLIERKRLNPRETRTVLEDVFHRAGDAKEPLPLRYAGPEPITALTSTLTDAHNLKLDALSIRCRAVRIMLGVDPRRGRQLFEEIPPVEVPKPACDHEFAPDPAVYVQTLAAIIERGEFSRQEREKQVPWWMIESGARRARNSWEIIGAMKTFPAFVRNEVDAKTLAAALAAALAITDSDRSFTSALRKGELIPTVLAAGSTLRRDGASDVSVLAALRGFLVRHLSGNRCKDSVPGTLDGIDAFNAAVRRRNGSPA